MRRLRDTHAFRARIEALDLEMIKKKLMDKGHGKGWSKAKADFVEIKYRRFLILTATAPRTLKIVPDKETDTFWHHHIFDTRKYREDCQALFGEFLDHYPYLGMNGREDAKLLADSFKATEQIYFETFGEVYRPYKERTPSRRRAGAARCARCAQYSSACSSNGYYGLK